MGNKAKPGEETWTSERCFIMELLNDERQAEISVAHTRVEAGVTTELHALSVSEWYVIKQGHGLMRVGDDAPFAVAPGDTVTIPKHVAQQITNTGRDDLCFLCICAPRFSRECYTSLE